MISSEQVTFTAYGDGFHPSKISAPYSNAHDPGATGKIGKYKNLPIPYGCANFDAPEDEKQKIAYLHRIIFPILGSLRVAGAEDFRLHITYGFQIQCSIGFSKEEIRMISDLQCDLPIDCWLDESAIENENHGA